MAELRPVSALDWRGSDAEPAGALVIRGARVLDPREGLDAERDVVIRDGEIASIGEPGSGQAEGAEVIEAEGLALFPAFFDPHVHLRTPGREDKEDVETGSRAAAAGGFCGIIAMANTEPPVDTAADVSALREQAREQAAVPTGFVATVTKGMRGEELSEHGDLAAAGAVGLSDDGLPIRSARVMRRALQYQRLVELPIALHEEDPELSAGGSMHEGEVSAALGIAGIPSISESTMIARDCSLAAFETARIHVQHLSASESVAAIEAAKAAGVQVSCEATPHHLTLTDEEVRTLDSRFKMNPPLRTEADRQALIEGIRSGTIDCIATDHAPHTSNEKEVPFEDAAMGVTGLETAFSVIYTELVLPGVLELATVIERLAGGAQPFGLQTPTIAPGAEANLTLCDLAAEWEAGAEGWESRSDNSCFAGRRLQGRVLVTVAAGRVAYRQRSFALGVA
ncbi:MAG: dihydroorotase [Solirubrobacterales bacterium]|nr:dihydroorotase [Solirubrobacterales bacterium]